MAVATADFKIGLLLNWSIAHCMPKIPADRVALLRSQYLIRELLTCTDKRDNIKLQDFQAEFD